MTEAPVVRLDMPARPEGVAVARQALTGVADGLALDRAVLSDAKMAVTEACTNAVVHAYPDGGGRLDVELFADEVQLTVVVRDTGQGLAGDTDTVSGGVGLGLPLIQALSDSFEVLGAPGEGTEVRMGFLYERQADPADENPIDWDLGDR